VRDEGGSVNDEQRRRLDGMLDADEQRKAEHSRQVAAERRRGQEAHAAWQRLLHGVVTPALKSIQERLKAEPYLALIREPEQLGHRPGVELVLPVTPLRRQGFLFRVSERGIHTTVPAGTEQPVSFPESATADWVIDQALSWVEDVLDLKAR
jgi:hypothetical protein